MITLASTNNLNVPLCPSSANEDTVLNLETNAGPMTDSKLHSQIPNDMYVFEYFILYNFFDWLIKTI